MRKIYFYVQKKVLLGRERNKDIKILKKEKLHSFAGKYSCLMEAKDNQTKSVINIVEGGLPW